MRVSREEMRKSHDRIVKGAARLVRQKGIDTTSVADVMADAGLTNGGFYRHFDTKEAMIAAALGAAFGEVLATAERAYETLGIEKAAAGYEKFYLSDAHVTDAGSGCPVAALAGDVARSPDSVKTEFGAGFRRMSKTFARAMEKDGSNAEVEAVRRLAMMAGAVMIARASDPETAKLVLAACRKRTTGEATPRKPSRRKRGSTTR